MSGEMPRWWEGAGILVPSDNVDALSGAIGKVFDDEKLRELFQSKSLAQNKSFTQDQMLSETSKVYKTALAI